MGKMKVLVTGASGFIGKACLEVLNQAGVELVILGRHKPEGSHQFIECDILDHSDFSSVMERVRPSHLLHLAWYAEHGKYWESPLNLQWVKATQKLTEAFCSSGGKHAVFAGTCAEYDWSQGECHEDTTLLIPSSLYGSAKVDACRIASAICEKSGVRFAWGRIFQPYGPFENRERLVPALIDVFCGRREPFGINGNFVRDFIYSKDVARAFLTLLSSNAAGCYNIASGKPLRLCDVATEIAKACQADANSVLTLQGKNTNGPPMIVGAGDKLKSLGWSIETNFQSAICEMLKA
jgi:nucleoside-diphosphate-sugar epimerase